MTQHLSAIVVADTHGLASDCTSARDRGSGEAQNSKSSKAVASLDRELSASHNITE